MFRSGLENKLGVQIYNCKINDKRELVEFTWSLSCTYFHLVNRRGF